MIHVSGIKSPRQCLQTEVMTEGAWTSRYSTRRSRFLFSFVAVARKNGTPFSLSRARFPLVRRAASAEARAELMGGWTASAVAASVALFLIAGVCEVGGGWLVWQACREVRDEGMTNLGGFSSKSERGRDRRSVVSSASRARLPSTRVSRASVFRTLLAAPQGKPWWWALIGSLILVLYGFVPCAQPIADFGRLYAAYGGFFVALSVAWARAFDGFKPDVGDFIGCAIALIGAGVIVFYPRQGGGVEPGSSAVFPKLASGA